MTWETAQPTKKAMISSETTVKQPKKPRHRIDITPVPTVSMTTKIWTNFDYFLVGGYAFISSAGLGTKVKDLTTNTVWKSMPLDISSNGSMNKAATDKTSNVENQARLGSRQCAYISSGLFWPLVWRRQARRRPYGDHQPAAGIACWYGIYNSQGTQFGNAPYSDLSWLSLYVNTRMLDQRRLGRDLAKLLQLLNQLNKDQYATDRNYSDVWRGRDYAFIRKISDFDRPWWQCQDKHFELMYDALRKQDKMSNSIF